MVNEKARIKVLHIGDGVVPTGFARVNHSIISRLPKDKYEIHHLAVNYSGDPHPFDHYIYPARKATNTSISSSALGFDRLQELAALVKPDIIFILSDAWVLAQYLAILKKIYAEEPLPKIVVYFPVDGEGYNPSWFNDFDIVAQAVTYTEFGKAVVQTAMPNLDIKVIGHGVDNKLFRPLHKSRKETRKLYFNDVIGGDDFVVINANRNSQRKMISTAFEGFAMFAKDKPDAKYFHHAGLKDAGWDVITLIDRLSDEYAYDVLSRFVFSNAGKGVQRVTDNELNLYYNITDVGLSTTIAEGWGLTPMEHAMTGGAQIVPRNTAIPEVMGDAALYIDPILTVRDHVLLLKRHHVHPEGVRQALETLYNDRGLVKSLSEKGMKRFKDPKYSWDTLAQQWDELYEEVLST